VVKDVRSMSRHLKKKFHWILGLDGCCRLYLLIANSVVSSLRYPASLSFEGRTCRYLVQKICSSCPYAIEIDGLVSQRAAYLMKVEKAQLVPKQ